MQEWLGQLFRGISRWCYSCGKSVQRWRWATLSFWSRRRTRVWARSCLLRSAPRPVFQLECWTSWRDPEQWAACSPDIVTSTKLLLPDPPRSDSYCFFKCCRDFSPPGTGFRLLSVIVTSELCQFFVCNFFFIIFSVSRNCIQCFDTVGWAAGRATSL